MPYATVYAKMSEEAKEKERQRARDWHKKNYEKIKERKQKQSRENYEIVGRKRYDDGIRNYRYKLGRILASSKTRSKARGIPHNLTLEYLCDLYEKQDGKCLLSGRKFYVGKAPKDCPTADAPSLDKIDPRQGYVMGNVRLVTHHMNMAMSNFGLASFLDLAKDVEKHNAK